MISSVISSVKEVGFLKTGIVILIETSLRILRHECNASKYTMKTVLIQLGPEKLGLEVFTPMNAMDLNPPN